MVAGVRVAQPPPCRGFFRGFAGGIGELRPAGSASAGRKLSARVTSIFLHKQLAANKHLNQRLRKPSARRAPLTRRGGGGGGAGRSRRVEGKMRGPESRGGVCARRFPKTRFPSSEALLKLPTKSRSIPGEVTDQPHYIAPCFLAWDPRALRVFTTTHPDSRGPRRPTWTQGASASAGRSHFAPISPDTTDS